MLNKTFQIIDPCMNSNLGHHHEFNITLANELVSLGYFVQIFCNKKYILSDLESKSRNIQIIPHFSVNPYSIFISQNLSESIERYNFAESVFYNEIKLISLSAIVHFSNLFSYQFLALPQIKCIKITACIHHHPDRYSKFGSLLWVNSWSKVKKDLNHFRMFVVEEHTINEFEKLTESMNSISLIPFPLSQKTQKPHESDNNTIGLLGGLRTEQGAKFLLQTIQIINSYNIKVVLHDVNNIYSSKTKSNNIIQVGYTENFSDLLHMCDAVLFNYDPDYYQYNGSGIIWETASHGIPLMYSKGIASSSVARKYGFGIPFSYSNKNSISIALSFYIENKIELLQKAKTIGLKIRLDNSINQHVRFLI